MISLCDKSFKHASSMRNFSQFVRAKLLADLNLDSLVEDYRLFSSKRILVIAHARLQGLFMDDGTQDVPTDLLANASDSLLEIIKGL